MPDSLLPAAEVANHLLTWIELRNRLLLAALFGFIVAGVYLLSQRRPPGQVLPLVSTLVLLTILVAMTTIVIGENLARAFGLVGALSIVRFRTVVDDTRDTSFVIFAVVVGMALGAGYLDVCLLGVPIVALAAVGLSYGGAKLAQAKPEPVSRRLEIRIGAGREPEQVFGDTFAAHLTHWKLTTVLSARQGTSLDLTYFVKLRDANQMLPLVKALQMLDGVQSVELKAE